MLTQKKFVNQQMPQTHPPATGSLNGLNLDLRDRYLAACLAQGMNETNVHIREITTLHVVGCAGDRYLLDFTIDELCGLLAESRNLENKAPLSQERLRKIFNHTREMLEVAQDEDRARESDIDQKTRRPRKSGRQRMDLYDLHKLSLARYMQRRDRNQSQQVQQPQRLNSPVNAGGVGGAAANTTLALDVMTSEPAPVGSTSVARIQSLSQTPSATNALPTPSVVTQEQSSAPAVQSAFTYAEILRLATCDTGQNRILQRAQACLCLQFLTGLRATPFVELAIGDVDMDAQLVRLRKPGSNFSTDSTDIVRVVKFLPQPMLYPVIRRWIGYLRSAVPVEVADLTKVFAVLDPATCTPVPAAQIGRRRQSALSDDYEELCRQIGIQPKGTEAVRRAHDQVYWQLTEDVPVLQQLDQMPARDRRALMPLLRSAGILDA